MIFFPNNQTHTLFYLEIRLRYHNGRIANHNPSILRHLPSPSVYSTPPYGRFGVVLLFAISKKLFASALSLILQVERL